MQIQEMEMRNLINDTKIKSKSSAERKSGAGM